jgi:hypothetical protein
MPTRGSMLVALEVCLAIAGCGGSSSSDGGTPAATTYTISGTLSGAAVAGVTVTLSGATSATTTTGSTGAYSFAGLANGTYTVTPSLAGHTFAPNSVVVAVSGASFPGHTFSPSSTPVTVSSANVTGQTFTATAVGNNIQTALQGTWLNCNSPESGLMQMSWWVISGSNSELVTLQDKFATCPGIRMVNEIHTWTFAIGSAVTASLGPSSVTAYQVDFDSSVVRDRYQLFYVDATVTPNRLYIGDSSGANDGSTPGKRPTTLWEIMGFSKQGPVTYSISGTVSGGVGPAVLTLSGATSATATASNGYFGFIGLANGNYIVTPSLAGYTFSPTSSSVTVNGASVSGLNFTATAVAATYSISGTVSGAVGLIQSGGQVDYAANLP